MPARPSPEYLTFQKIVEAEYELPPGVPPAAADLIARLLVLEPADRLGERSGALGSCCKVAGGRSGTRGWVL